MKILSAPSIANSLTRWVNNCADDTKWYEINNYNSVKWILDVLARSYAFRIAKTSNPSAFTIDNIKTPTNDAIKGGIDLGVKALTPPAAKK